MDNDKDDISVLTVTHNDPRFEMVADIRRRVFIEEQNVPSAEEWDAIDSLATHLVLLRGGEALGTLRFSPDEGWLHIGRMAILPAHRGQGLGKALMEKCLGQGRRLGFARAYVNAQTDKCGFYEKMGYGRVGDEFMDAGIPHCRMEMDL